MKTIGSLKKCPQVKVLNPVDDLHLKGGGVVKGIDNLEAEIE